MNLASVLWRDPGLLLDRVGLGVLALSSGLGLASTAALLALRTRPHASVRPVAVGVAHHRP